MAVRALARMACGLPSIWCKQISIPHLNFPEIAKIHGVTSCVTPQSPHVCAYSLLKKNMCSLEHFHFARWKDQVRGCTLHANEGWLGRAKGHTVLCKLVKSNNTPQILVYSIMSLPGETIIVMEVQLNEGGLFRSENVHILCFKPNVNLKVWVLPCQMSVIMLALV